MRGPLTRMTIGRTTARVDLTELDDPRRRAGAILQHVLLRNDQSIGIDPGILAADPQLEHRLRRLHAQAALHRRDTGVDGLHLGFPFLTLQEAKPRVKPRIAPILLWPIRLNPEVGARGRITLAFDRDREEVRLNPALETLLGVEAANRWREAAHALLSRSSINVAEAMEAFRALAAVEDRELKPLPSGDRKLDPGDDRILCAAVLFHLGFIGQAVMEDLRRLKAAPPEGSGLEIALRIGEDLPRSEAARIPEEDRYFTADSDPSQEAAVLEARDGRGLLIEGPPGSGKSQTIVNMVADAIGSGRSLLVVCQKQAALEVVHKRLEAVGLGGRVVMVNDVNRDREPVIRAVREQLEELARRPPGPTPWRRLRQQTAARIETLERDLDGRHKALHATDPRTGLSCRLILGDLIGLADAGETPALPALRRRLEGLDAGRVTQLQEACAPVAALWLAARPEGSALVDVRPFGTDDAAIQACLADLRAFSQREDERLAVLARTPQALAVDDPEACRRWSAAHGSILLELDPALRRRLARWLDPLAEASGRPSGKTAAQETLAGIERDLLDEAPDESSDASGELARGMSDAELRRWSGLSERLLEAPGLLGGLSPFRWSAARRRRRLFAREGLADAAAFDAALRREARMRPLRARLEAVLREIGEPLAEGPPLRRDRLLAAAQEALGRLAEVQALVARLEACPEGDAARTMARAANRTAVQTLVEGLAQSAARHDARAASSAALERAALWMTEDWSGSCALAIAGEAGNRTRLEALEGDLPRLAAYQRFRARVPHLGEEAMALFAELGGLREKLEALPQEEVGPTVGRVIATEARLAWKARLEAEDPTLLLEDRELEARAAALAAADAEMRALNRRLLAEGIDTDGLAPVREWEDVTRLRGARARRLREFVERGADLGLMRLRPVWLVNPDVASRLLPLRKALFDRVIFDEASQMPIEYALPTLYRSRSLVVSGDEKQMPPSAFFSGRLESDEAEVYEGREEEEGLDEEAREALAETWDRREIKDCPDLLQLARTTLPAATLQIHYRSVYRELIGFSNAAFYAGRLSVPARHPAEEVRRARPIEMIRVDGVYEDQTNPGEAGRVVETLRGLLASEAPPTVGVVTFNRRQADLIEEMLEERAEEDPVFRSALARERDRMEDGEDVGFFVKNVENVQGDERDVIIFSSTFGRNAQGAFRRFFGALGQNGGERRLNVATTRARRKIVLVTSMPIPLISDFLSTRRPSQSPRDFLQAYFEYARCVSEGDLGAAEALLARFAPERRPNRSRKDHDLTGDGLQEAVAAEIRALGWEPRRVEDEGVFGLDFAIEDPRTGLYGLGVECDAPRHGLLASARAREIWRPGVLRRSIPALHRVSSQGWLQEPERERARLRAAVAAAMGEQA